MEIDCSEKLCRNEKSAAKELNIDDIKSGEECGLADKEQKDMVANTAEGAATKTANLTAATAGADTESGTDDGGSGDRPAEFAQKVIDSQDCDKTPEKCMETKSQTDLSSSPGQDDKEDAPELLTPMAEYTEQEGQVVEEEEEECEKSSSVKGCEEELISDTEDYNEEQDAGDITEIIEDDDDEDENDTSSVPSELENMNRSKGSSDVEEDSDEDEYNEDGDDEVELVPDSSDEEGSEDSRNVSSRNLEIPQSDDDDNYDDDDLMNDVIMASTKVEEPANKRKEESSSGISKLKNTVDFKKKQRWDYRTQLKKRSVRWLIKRLHKEPLPGVQYACRSQGSELVKASPAQIKSKREIEVISIDLDDSPEKSQPATSLLSHQLKESPVKPPVFEMQQVDKIRDSIQSAEDLKQQQQQHVKSLKDEQNKENVENNDKLLNNSLKLNGNVSNAKTEDKAKGDGEKSENSKDMEVSLEDGDEKSSEQTIVENTVEKIEKAIDEENRDEQVKADETNQEKAAKTDKNLNEAEPNEVSQFERTATTEERTICKESVATDLKITPRTSKRSRSASLENSPKLEDIHPTKKLRAELESNFPTHDRILSEYIDKTSNNSVDEIQKHMNQLIIEIQTLNDMIKAKEIEWNNMLHLKKVKEEICFRLSRKKQVMEIMSTKTGEAAMAGGEDTLNDTILQNPISKPLKLVSSTPNTSAAAPNSSASGIAASSGNAGSTAQSILQNRANMKSSDLAKEKANTQRLHRLLVSRNILPKPSSTSTTAVAGFGASPQVSIPSISTMLASSPATAAAAAAATSATGLMNIPLSLASGSLANNGTHGTQQPILNSYLTAAATVQQQLGEMLNGHHNPSLLQQGNTNGGQTLMVGRQGVFKDVKSIIADYRQRHPEAVPRRGRRVKSNPSATDSSSILSNVLKNDGKLAGLDLGAVLTKFDGNSRPSSNDSSHSMTNLIGTNSNSANLGNVSFKDVLVQFAKMSGQTDRMGTATANKLPGSSAAGSGSQSAPPPYPEVTLHPVSTTQSNVDQTGSLLHGILTKYTRPNASSATSAAPTSTSQTTVSQSFSSSFSPTLARLLTAPERITTAQNSQPNSNSFQANLQAVQSAVAGSGLNLSKVVGHNSEITITPVLSGQPLQQTLVQQQFQHQQQQQLKEIRERVKAENMLNLDAEADDSVDRLVIDEGGDSAGMDGHHRIAPHAIGQEFHENEVPACQGCKKQEAQFVCAGCGNQWYCSRECQVAAWDEHSEVCTG